MLHELTLSVLTVNLLGAELTDDSHSIGGLNHVHLAGLVLLPVSLTSLHLAAQVQLSGAKVASATVAVHDAEDRLGGYALQKLRRARNPLHELLITVLV